ncbi:MAG: hypothetical protein ABI268_07190 [Rhodanobacter sp.]
MRATHWILGCALGLACMGTAVAASLDTQGVDNATHATTSRISHDGDSSGGDSVGIVRETGTTNNSEATGASRSSNDHSGAAASAPAPAPRPHLGWQSLLPGSIQ